MADNDRMNGEALPKYGRDHRTAGASDDWRHSSEGMADRDGRPSSSPSPFSSNYVATTPASRAEMTSKVWLEVTEDKSHPEGGYALIRLHGLRSLPADATFTILPGDQHRDTGVALLGWPEGEHRPVSRRDIADGIEIGVGPDVVDCPALLPGTPVIIDIAAASVRGEILWPSVASRPGRLPPAVIPPGARRFPQAQGPGEIDHEGPVLSELPRRSAPEVIELAALPTPAHMSARAAPDFSNLAALAASLAAQGRNAGAFLAPPASAAVPNHSDEPHEGGASSSFPAEAADSGARTQEAPQPSPSNATATDAPTPTPPAPPPPSISPDHERLEPSAPRNRSDIVVAPARIPLKPVEIPNSSLIDRPVPPPVDRLSRGLAGIALFAALLAAGSSLMVLYTLRGMLPGTATASTIAALSGPVETSPKVTAGSSAGLEGGAAVSTPPAPTVATAAIADKAVLFDIFSPGVVSPRGRSAADVDRDAALALADTHIHGDAATVDLKEGEFWIRHAVGRLMADGRLKWALTQLGSVYAAPGETSPDFEKARLIWEISGALGDAVALCFLGNLHEYGLGVPASREAAQRWYERGRAAGGCKGNDEAIARVKR